MVNGKLSACFLIGFMLMQLGCGPAAILQQGECQTDQSGSTTVFRELDGSYWCLQTDASGLLESKWSDYGNTFAYALNDGMQQRTYKGVTIEAPIYKWFVVDVNSGRSFHYKGHTADFTWSPDGNYVIQSADPRLINLQSTRYIINIKSNAVECEFQLVDGFHSSNTTACAQFEMKDGQEWDIATQINQQACEFRDGSFMVSDEQYKICSILVEDWELRN